ncbi:hypothetical protein AMAG_02180 [Allomyces macrogynus ATCC 38327]|uniref:Metallo-beta-lactamase domain-containing protein n=1 Tax=Allomyces macrogynus (strain ATCC 38327) TaxID=578462 RepID=A0A0L0S1T5_ALLM3|nr:hypothetical protein AMAG_02180 [Allomyces macrogynus ATCC 38327]|eukprot:KNE56361.1 hypothetical protein AMAG_02180 [Allomyces macrogynus ATCC 38327]
MDVADAGNAPPPSLPVGLGIRDSPARSMTVPAASAERTTLRPTSVSKPPPPPSAPLRVASKSAVLKTPSSRKVSASAQQPSLFQLFARAEPGPPPPPPATAPAPFPASPGPIPAAHVDADDRDSPAPTSARPRRLCPFYKKIPDTTFAVDAFSYGAIPGITGYFLTHSHSDHYGGLSGTFTHGPIYASTAKANLVRHTFKRVRRDLVRELPMNEPVVVDGCRVTCFDANQNAPLVVSKRVAKRNPPRLTLQPWPHPDDFLPPGLVVNSRHHLTPVFAECVTWLLILVGSYTIGKEKVFPALRVRFYWDAKKWAILQCLSDPALLQWYSPDPRRADVHVVSMGALMPPTKHRIKMRVGRGRGYRGMGKGAGARAVEWGRLHAERWR